MIPMVRPDANWRDYLSPLVADEEAQYSQTYEELIIRDFFQDRRSGVYVDVGCYLPRKLSTTAYLDFHLDWTGIAIDAIARFGDRWKEVRPRAKFFAYAVTDRDGDVLTFHERGPVSSLDEEWVENFGESVEIKVPTITLNTLLDQEGITKVDFVSMDIEGSEPGALTGFDIKRFAPDLVCIEHGPAEKDEWLLEYFGKNGYERIEKYDHIDKINWYFRRTEAPAS